VKFGLLPPYRTGVTADPDWMAAFATHAESCGFESLYVAEHVVVAADYSSKYPYSDTGRMPLDERVDIPDPLELLTYVAARTTTLRLATGILVLPEHHPVVLAKRAATIDRLSGGRLTLGVGVGWMREELEAVGIDASTRGARTDECIDALRILWRDDEATYDGRYYDFARVCSFPKPVNGTVPIHVGGHSDAAARRAGKRGDGFQPLGIAGDELADRLDVMRRAADDAERDPDAIELTVSGGLTTTLTDNDIAAATKTGARRMLMSTRHSDLNEVKDQLSAFSERFV
jgi:probable F420-dependent oxidoreductase